MKIINRKSYHPQSQGLVERANGILQQKLEKWKEDTGRQDWFFKLYLIILSINYSYYHSYKKTSYKLVYSNKLWKGSTLIKKLFNKNIYDKKSIPKKIKIKDLEDIVKNLDDDIIYG